MAGWFVPILGALAVMVVASHGQVPPMGMPGMGMPGMGMPGMGMPGMMGMSRGMGGMRGMGGGMRGMGGGMRSTGSYGRPRIPELMTCIAHKVVLIKCFKTSFWCQKREYVYTIIVCFLIDENIRTLYFLK